MSIKKIKSFEEWLKDNGHKLEEEMTSTANVATLPKRLGSNSEEDEKKKRMKKK